MMGGETFILLKAGLLGPKSANQAENGLAVLPAILWIARLEERSAVKAEGIPVADFYGTWLIRKIDRFCYLDHGFSSKIGTISRRGKGGKLINVFTSNTIHQITTCVRFIHAVTWSINPKCKLKYFVLSRDDSIDAKSIVCVAKSHKQ
jgi:hypothetical protein